MILRYTARQHQNLTGACKMITAYVLKTITGFDSLQLTNAIKTAGYKKDSFIDAQFIGITTGNQFAYSATYLEEDKKKSIKVFLSYNQETNKITAGY